MSAMQFRRRLAIRRQLVAALLLAAFPLAAQGEVVIDTFVTQQLLQLDPGGANLVTDAATAPETLGGQRDVELERLTGNGGVSLTINAQGEEWLSCSAGGGTAVRCSLSWEGTGGLGGVDLTQGGANDAFRVWASSDIAATIEIQVRKASDGTLVTAQLALPGGDADFVERFLPLAEFGPNGPAVVADADQVLLEIMGPAGLDAQLDDVSFTVPEPSQAEIVAISTLLALAGRRRWGRARPPG
jgi:hypothetical protein